MLVSEGRVAAVVALDDALQTLSALDSRKGRVVELRFFGGFSVDEAAESLKIWRRASSAIGSWRNSG